MNATFWQLIENAKGEPEQLVALLKKHSDEDLAGFAKAFHQCLIDLNRWEVWGAGYVMAGGMGDDSFHYFRSWIIGKGKEAYETALSNPDLLGKFADEDDEFDNELLEYVAIELLEKRGLPDPRDEDERKPDDEPGGVAWDEDSVYELYPKLTAQFGE